METKEMVPKLRFPGFEDTWNLTKISENFEFKNGLNKEKEFFGKGTPIINFTDVYHLGKITEKHIVGKVTLSKGEIERYRVLVGDVFFTRTSESIHDIGMTSVLVEDVTDCVFSGFVLRARPKNKNLNPLFNAYSFKRHSVRKEIVTKSSMTTRALTSGTLLNGVLFSYPTINEQQKIASFLSSVDNKISQLEKKKTLLETYKRGIMQKIFSQELRFKDENGEEFPEWEEKRLGDIAALIKDGSHGTHKDCPASKYYLLSAKNIKEGKLVYDETDRRISESDYFSIYKNYKLKKGDILLTIVGTIGNVAIIRDEENIAFQRSVAILRFLYMDSLFSSYIFQDQLFQRILAKKKVVSAQPGIYLGELGKIMIRVPCTKEQQKIASFLSSIDKKIEITSTQLEKTREFKKGLLQQMFV